MSTHGVNGCCFCFCFAIQDINNVFKKRKKKRATHSRNGFLRCFLVCFLGAIQESNNVFKEKKKKKSPHI